MPRERVELVEKDAPPFVSVVIPCRNERRFIRACLESVLKMDYPRERMEIIVSDGMSRDGTRDILDDYQRRYPSLIRTINNEKLLSASAMNRGIESAKGAIIVRLDAHSVYEKDYVTRSVDLLARTGAANVGGVRKPSALGRGVVDRAISVVTSSAFGVGPARYRFATEITDVDTVPCGTFRRRIFDMVGYFDERLVRNQDNELNARIRRAGERVVMSPEIRATYYNRLGLIEFVRTAFVTGLWNVYTLQVNRHAFRVRHFVPGLLTLWILGGAAAALALGVVSWWIAPLVVYLFGVLLASVQGARRQGVFVGLVLPTLFMTYHLAYGLGEVVGAIRFLIGQSPVSRSGA